MYAVEAFDFWKLTHAVFPILILPTLVAGPDWPMLEMSWMLETFVGWPGVLHRQGSWNTSLIEAF